MLSIENPPPSESDPPHPCHQLKKKKLSNLPHLDPSPPPSSSSSLSSSSSSFDNHHHNSKINPKLQTPNFSIRDYVFALRNKDVKKNWPFSLENLQLCLNHGVKDPLPPFQTFDSVKNNQSPKPCTVKVITDVETKVDDAPTIKNVADDSGKFKPRSENDELPSTSTSVLQSEIESVEGNQSAAVKDPPLRGRTENTSKLAAKKCRIVVKFGSVSAEDIASNLTSASEHMASSKICPVCKTFSSSSNTTLNAHIDQCLASGSKPALVPGSGSLRHKIKPRKIRLMKDIYKTAKECTLEELDRRNGVSWAEMNSNVPGFDAGMSDGIPEEAENQRVSSSCSKEPPVYVDANGTKVRILSKLDDDDNATRATKARKVVNGTKQPMKGGKRGKIFSTKKKSRHGKKRHKYLKLVPQSTKLLTQKAHTSQVSNGLEGCSREDNQKNKEKRVPKQVKPVSSPANSRHWQWVPLKCSTATKELNKKGCRRNPPSENNVSCLQNSFARRNYLEKVSHCSGNKVGNVGRSLLPMKRSSDHLRNVSSSTHQSLLSRSAETSRICASPLGRKKICSSAKKTLELGSKTLRVLSAGKKVSIRLQSAAEDKFDAGDRCFSLNRPQFLDEGDEDLVTREPSMEQECDLMQNEFENHRDGEMVPQDTSHLSQEEPVALHTSRGMSLDNGEIADSSARVPNLCHDETDSLSYSDSDEDEDDNDDDNSDDDDIFEEYDGLEIAEERATTGLSRFLATEIIRRNRSETPFDSSQSIDEFTGASFEGQALLRQSEPSFLRGQEVYSSREVGNVISDQATCMDIKLDSETAHGCSFPEVEPIPIPGPPGSFLPSPRGMMASDDLDFPGHSSLTTSPVRSSEDHRDFVDRISSDSPVSMASTVSNSTIAGRLDQMKYFEQFSSGGMAPCQEKNLDSAASSQQTSLEPERNSETERFSLSRIAAEKKPFGFRRDDDQPCCCQRKEKYSQGYISLNFQDSQLLKRRTTASSEKQMGISPNMKPSNSGPDNSRQVSEPEFLTDVPKKKPFLEEPSVLKPSFDTDRASSSPSGSNPVLRLMGKNLMVINIEEDASTPLSHVDSASKPPVPTVPSFHFMAPRGSLMFDHDPRNASHVRSCFSSDIIPLAPQSSSQQLSQNHYTVPFSLLKPQNSSSGHREAPELHNNDRFSAIPLKRANTSPVRLSCTPEASGNMNPRSVMAAPPSATHLGSSLYYS